MVLRRNLVVAICKVEMQIRAPSVDTVFYIKNYKTKIGKILKFNTNHEHLLTKIRFRMSK